MTVNEKLNALRVEMRTEGIDAYVVLTDDFHASEYVGAYFKAREYLSGFTGSAGSLVVLADRALLWTDGRYFLQAAEELAPSEILLMRDREPGVPTVTEFLSETLPEGAVIGYDGRTVSREFAKLLATKTEKKGITFRTDVDLVDRVWPGRPALSHRPVYELELSQVGVSRVSKLSAVRANMGANGVDFLIITALEDTAWLLNLRGDDVQCTPVLLSFMLLSGDRAVLFVQDGVIPEDVMQNLKNDGVELAPYGEVYAQIAALPAGARVQYDARHANSFICDNLPADAVAVDARSPIEAMRAVKSPAECENMRIAHIKDGVALVKFMHWLKKTVGKETVTELSAAARLEEFRGENEGYLGASFEPILAYGAHGAIVHYSPSAASNATMEPHGLCLADTGAQYREGTTDVTRTYAVGPVTDEEKRAYTLVLRGHLALGAAKFKYGLCGENLDILARAPLWEAGLDYNHGTGHGVGFLLGVHEGPHRIHWGIFPGRGAVKLEEGMISSNEPGYYEPGKFGIRHENLVLVRKGEKTEYGQFMYFEPLTLAPFDKDAMDVSLLTEADKAALNAYHKEVYQKLSPYLDTETAVFLADATAPV